MPLVAESEVATWAPEVIGPTVVTASFTSIVKTEANLRDCIACD